LIRRKDARNRRERGLPLVLGAVVLANLVVEYEDDQRMIAYGVIAGRIHVCVYTVRDETWRIISLRKANQREQRRWRP
jgi:uncharacterized DUF497 family protein